MKRTKENILKVLKAKAKHKRRMQKIFNDDKSIADAYEVEAMTLEEVVFMLENKKYFDDIVEIYNVEE